jgi:hypothetical protein
MTTYTTTRGKVPSTLFLLQTKHDHTEVFSKLVKKNAVICWPTWAIGLTNTPVHPIPFSVLPVGYVIEFQPWGKLHRQEISLQLSGSLLLFLPFDTWCWLNASAIPPPLAHGMGVISKHNTVLCMQHNTLIYNTCRTRWWREHPG